MHETVRIAEADRGAEAWMLGREDLVRNRRATGRTQDLADAAFLERLAH